MDANLLTAEIAEEAAEKVSGGDAAPAAPAEVDEQVPAKFLDPETGQLRVDLLLKSYKELERKLARMVEVPVGDAAPAAASAFRKAIGVPERPDDYPINPKDPTIRPDPDVNRRLHEAGFTPDQAQLVYDLAAERMGPVIKDMASEFEANRQLDRLADHFGGEETWREVAKSLNAWGRKSLPSEVFDALSTTFEGVITMNRMMTSGEPALGVGDGRSGGVADEEELRRLMADPRYWRDHDPAIVRQVTEGFKRLFPDSGQA